MTEHSYSKAEGALRYNFSASLARESGYISDDRWFDEATIRSHLQNALKCGRYEQESIEVHVQILKSRWLPLRHGKVSTIFPALWAEWQTDRQVGQFLSQTCLEIGQPAGSKIIYRQEIEAE